MKKSIYRNVATALALLGLSLSSSIYAAADPNRLGAQYDKAKTNITFTVYSNSAERIELDLYAGATGTHEVKAFGMTKGLHGKWSLTVSAVDLKAYGLVGTVYYGFRAWGPNWPYSSAWTKGSSVGFLKDVDSNGNRFNPNKLLADPYAKELSHDPLTPTMANGTAYASGPLYRNVDTGSFAPKGIVLAPVVVATGVAPTRPFKDDIIYEAHVRGLTMSDASIAPMYRGTYKGAGQKAAYLANLGITAIELLPVQETQNDTNDVDPFSSAGDNYWGYMTLNYFSPDRRYSFDKTPGGPTREFKEMVKAYHDVGIKVLIDVVYNHTGEGGAWSEKDTATYNIHSLRGLDNATYYSLTNDKQFTWDNTGAGGNYNTHNPIAQDLIVDSLAYWRDVLGVDGFRFDLASVLGNSCEHGCFNYDKLDSKNALNRIAADIPSRPAAGGSGVELIAEPWAIGGNSYQVGNFPSGWSDWNGKYRDTLRLVQNRLGHVDVPLGTLATRVAGSSDLYDHDGRKPWHSVNFMTAHDGFTLKDLYSCNDKSNKQLWPLGPSDGGESNNNSWDQGGGAASQRQAARTALALLMLSGGVPMMVGGDEALRSLNCNNNPYNIDSNANWLSWSWSADQSNFQGYARAMIAFRNAHPALRPANFYSGIDNNGNVMEQMRWFKPNGSQADSTYFNDPSNHAIAWRIDGTELGDTAAAIYIAYNAWSSNVNFSLPWPGYGKSWHRVTDTCSWAEGAVQVNIPGRENAIGGEATVYDLCARGVVLMIAK